jgi:hypothetical protein
MLTKTEYLSCSFHEAFLLAEAAHILTTLRISSEWVVGGVREVFKVMSKKRAANNIEIGWIISKICSRLMNVRVRLMKKRQTLSTFHL